MARTRKDNFEDMVKITGQKTQDVLDQATGGTGRQTPASEEEREARMNAGRTQGRLGCKLKRINMAFTPENYDFIVFASNYKGTSMTKYLNYIIDQYREEHAEAFDRAKGTAEEL